MSDITQNQTRAACAGADGIGVPKIAPPDLAPRIEIGRVLVVSTAHVTAREAQALTDQGYDVGRYGWFFHAGVESECVLSEFEPVCEGLSGVICWARRSKCQYVLLDCDADPLPEVATYDW